MRSGDARPLLRSSRSSSSEGRPGSLRPRERRRGLPRGCGCTSPTHSEPGTVHPARQSLAARVRTRVGSAAPASPRTGPAGPDRSLRRTGPSWTAPVAGPRPGGVGTPRRTPCPPRGPPRPRGWRPRGRPEGLPSRGDPGSRSGPPSGPRTCPGPRRSPGGTSGRPACRRWPPRGGSAPGSSDPRGGSRASNPASHGGRRDRSSPHPGGDHGDDLLRSLLAGVDHEVEHARVAQIDPVDRLVADPLGLLPGDDLPLRLGDSLLLAAGDATGAHLEGRVPALRWVSVVLTVPGGSPMTRVIRLSLLRRRPALAGADLSSSRGGVGIVRTSVRG